MAMGERTPVALLDGPGLRVWLSQRQSPTSAPRPVRKLSDIRLSANWMCAAGESGEGAALYDTVRALGKLEFCPALGIAIPVGKDSMSMQTRWQDAEGEQTVTAPLSLIVSAFAPVGDTLQRSHAAAVAPTSEHCLLLVDLGRGRNRLGASALAQVYGVLGTIPGCRRSGCSARVFRAHAVGRRGRRHSCLPRPLGRRDAGDAALEMAFAGRCGLDLESDGRRSDPLAMLFAEEAGALLQVEAAAAAAWQVKADELGLAGCVVRRWARPWRRRPLRFARAPGYCCAASAICCSSAGLAPAIALQRLRDNPDCADEEFARIAAHDPGLSVRVLLNETELAPPTLSLGARPRVAVLREQGVNGQVEMAAAFDRAGFSARST
jgi:phosphoribosylformylglycinamidine synthase